MATLTLKKPSARVEEFKKKVLGLVPSTPRDVQDELKKKYPIVFNIKKPIPLAVGIHEQIHKRNPDWQLILIRKAVGAWVKNISYQKKLAAEDSLRWNLDGSAAGKVSDEDRLHAAEGVKNK